MKRLPIRHALREGLGRGMMSWGGGANGTKRFGSPSFGRLPMHLLKTCHSRSTII
ncbi:MAG: hypothetical protein R3C05_25775 [Pirellulaceae bacterium]